MAFGFPAFHEAVLTLGGKPQVWLHEVISAVEGLGWILQDTSHDAVTARVRWGAGASTGGRVFVTGLSGGTVLVRSECLYRTQCIDWGRNKANVERLVAHLRQLFVTTEG